MGHILGAVGCKEYTTTAQIKGLDVQFQMLIIVNAFVVVQYLKNEKNRKFEKKLKIAEMTQNGPK